MGGSFNLNSELLLSYLKEGTIVGTKLGSSYAWYQNIIFKNKGDIVYLSIIDSYLENAIMPGTSIYLKFTNELFHYIYEGTVLDISLEYPKFISVKIYRTEELVNTRSFPRYDAYIPMNIKAVWDKTFNFSIAINVSLIGIAFISKYKFEYGEDCDASIYLPCNEILELKGNLVRKTNKDNFTEYGMQYTEMSEKNSLLLSDYFSKLGEEELIMENDYHEKIKKYFVDIN